MIFLLCLFCTLHMCAATMVPCVEEEEEECVFGMIPLKKSSESAQNFYNQIEDFTERSMSAFSLLTSECEVQKSHVLLKYQHKDNQNKRVIFEMESDGLPKRLDYQNAEGVSCNIVFHNPPLTQALELMPVFTVYLENREKKYELHLDLRKPKICSDQHKTAYFPLNFFSENGRTFKVFKINPRCHDMRHSLCFSKKKQRFYWKCLVRHVFVQLSMYLDDDAFCLDCSESSVSRIYRTTIESGLDYVDSVPRLESLYDADVYYGGSRPPQKINPRQVSAVGPGVKFILVREHQTVNYGTNPSKKIRIGRMMADLIFKQGNIRGRYFYFAIKGSGDGRKLFWQIEDEHRDFIRGIFTSTRGVQKSGAWAAFVPGMSRFLFEFGLQLRVCQVPLLGRGRECVPTLQLCHYKCLNTSVEERVIGEFPFDNTNVSDLSSGQVKHSMMINENGGVRLPISESTPFEFIFEFFIGENSTVCGNLGVCDSRECVLSIPLFKRHVSKISPHWEWRRIISGCEIVMGLAQKNADGTSQYVWKPLVISEALRSVVCIVLDWLPSFICQSRVQVENGRILMADTETFEDLGHCSKLTIANAYGRHGHSCLCTLSICYNLEKKSTHVIDAGIRETLILVAPHGSQEYKSVCFWAEEKSGKHYLHWSDGERAFEQLLAHAPESVAFKLDASGVMRVCMEIKSIVGCVHQLFITSKSDFSYALFTDGEHEILPTLLDKNLDCVDESFAAIPAERLAYDPQFGYPSQQGALGPQFGYPSQQGALGPQFGYPSQQGALGPQFGYLSQQGALGPQFGYPNQQVMPVPQMGWSSQQVVPGLQAGWPGMQVMYGGPCVPSAAPQSVCSGGVIHKQ